MSAAGEALQILPPRVARFWLAMEPVQEADWMRSGSDSAIIFAAANVGEGGAGADMDGVGGDVDEAELGEVVDGEEGFLVEAAGGEGDHELGAAGDGGGLFGRGSDASRRWSGFEGRWGGECVIENVGVHGFVLRVDSKE